MIEIIKKMNNTKYLVWK